MKTGGSKTLQEYLKYWQIKESIFQRPIDLDHLYIPERWASYLERVTLFSGQSSSLITITSPPGHCKSTMAKWVYHSLGMQSHEILLLSLFREEHKPGWLIPKVGKYFGVQSGTDLQILEKVADAINEINREGRLVTFIIDEAHKIRDPQAFSELHGLVSLQSLVSLGVNCLLVGNNFLMDVLNHTEELKSRLCLSLDFSSLSIQETADYIRFRLGNSSINSGVFSTDAMESIFTHSGGIFSRLNALLENCLIEAFIKREKAIDFNIVEEAARFLPPVNFSSGSVSQSPGRQSQESSTSRMKDASPKIIGRRKTDNDGTGQKSVELSSLFYKADDK